MSSPPPPPPGRNPEPTNPWSSPAPPPGYIAPAGYSPYGAYSQAREHPSGTTVLVLGILSLVVCGVLGPFAWSMGTKALREMDASPGVVWTNRGNVNAGRICGIVATCFLGVAVLIFLVVIAAAAGLGGS